MRLETVLRELDAIGPERVCLEDLGASPGVFGVDGPHQVGGPGVQFIVALVDEHPPGIQHRPYRAVEDDDAFRVEEAFEQGGTGGHRRASMGSPLASGFWPLASAVPSPRIE